MGAIFRLTLPDNLRSLRFQLSLVVVLAFFVGNGLIYSWKGERAFVEEAQILDAAEAQYRAIESPADAASRTYRLISLPTGTEFIAEAGSDWFPYAFNTTPQTLGNNSFGSSRGTNGWLRDFQVVDWSFIVRYVVSFLCIALAYNAISGEREAGTLRLLLANPLPRAHVLLGKYAAHLLSLMTAVAVGAVVSLLIMGLSGVLALDGRVALLSLGFLVATAIYTTVFLLVGMGVSAATGRSSTSLVVLVLLWALFLVVIPQVSRLTALTTMPTFEGSSWDLRAETARLVEERGLALRPLERARTDGYEMERAYAEEHRRLDDRLQALERAWVRHQTGQYWRARWVNTLSPGFAFQYAVEALTANGIQRFEHFAPQAWDYLAALRTFLRTRDEADPDSPHVLFYPDYMSRAELDPREVPRLVEDRLSPWESLGRLPEPLLLLVVEALVALWFALLALHRAPVAEAADG